MPRERRNRFSKERERYGLAMLTVVQRVEFFQQMVSCVEREIRRPTLETVLRAYGQRP